MGNAVQSNSIAASFHTAFGIPQWVMGLIVAVLAVFIFSGGMKRIAKVTETMVPLMAALYIVGSLVVIICNWRNIPLAFYEIFVGAFAPASIAGGAVGATIKLAITKGVARGLFSNEAGMGSTPHAHAVAKVAHPVEQGHAAMIGVFIDTFIVLTMTALVIVTTRALPESYNVVEGGYTGAELSQFAYSLVYGKFGEIFIAVCMFFFAFSTIVGWYFFGQANIKYLFGSKAVPVYSVLVCICVFLGSLAQVDLVWNMADCFNSLMVVPNIIGLLALSGMVKKVHDDYFNNFLRGKASEYATKENQQATRSGELTVYRVKPPDGWLYLFLMPEIVLQESNTHILPKRPSNLNQEIQRRIIISALQTGNITLLCPHTPRKLRLCHVLLLSGFDNLGDRLVSWLQSLILYPKFFILHQFLFDLMK